MDRYEENLDGASAGQEGLVFMVVSVKGVLGLSVTVSPTPGSSS